MSAVDLNVVRNDTPGCLGVAHLNNAGSSLAPRVVVDDVVDYLRLEEALGGYETAERESARLERLYTVGAALLGCAPTELALTTNASEAWWRAFSSVPLVAGDRVLTGRAEYVANALGLIQARHRGIDVIVVPDDESGQIDLDALRAAAADERSKLIALTHVPTNGGLVNPAVEVGAIARDAGVLYLLDACQSVGQLPVDVEELQCDFLSLTGRKYLRGPRGTGLLYVRQSVLEQLLPPTFIDGHSAAWTNDNDYRVDDTAHRFELFESNLAGKSGLATAIEYALGIGIENIEARVSLLSSHLRSQLAGIAGVEVRDRGARLSGIVTFDLEGRESSEIRHAATNAGINVSLTSRSPWQTTGDGVVGDGVVGDGVIREELVREGLDRAGLVRDMVRASPHYFNTEAEIDRFCTVVADVARH